MIETLVSVVIGAVVGFVLGWLPTWFDRRRKLRTHWLAIRAEMERCKENAETLLDTRPTIPAPSYRLPTVAFNTAFPILLSEGELTEEESRIIGRCFDRIGDINRGMDYASELHKQVGKTSERDNEYNRNCEKVRALLGKDGKPSLYDPAKAIVDAKVSRPRWGY